MQIQPNLLVAEGDSWFNHPKIRWDVIGRLGRPEFGYEVESVAHWSDTLKHMVYDRHERADLTRVLESLAKAEKVPRAVLLSGGGNDLIEMLDFLVNDKKSSSSAVFNYKMLDAFLQCCILEYYKDHITHITELCRTNFGQIVPILVHGYAYLVPDGRDTWSGRHDTRRDEDKGWIDPILYRNGHTDLQTNTNEMEKVIDKFNQTIEDISTIFEHVLYIDLRPQLSNDVSTNGYKKDWRDEIHPTSRGFEQLARIFDKAIGKFGIHDPSRSENDNVEGSDKNDSPGPEKGNAQSVE